jgi:hypothetical protein
MKGGGLLMSAVRTSLFDIVSVSGPRLRDSVNAEPTSVTEAGIAIVATLKKSSPDRKHFEK